MNVSSPPANPRIPSRRPDWLLPVLLCALASLALLAPFFWLGCASGHDFEFHVASWLDVAYQWHHGILFPRWTSWTNYGFGEPRYIFYPPLSWILGAALTLLLPISWVPGAFIFLTQTFAGLCAFLLLRRLASRKAACLGAVFYTVNPYAILLTYVRSDFAEQLACAIFPLLLLAALRLAKLLPNEKRRRFSIIIFAVAFAACWLCNAPAAVLASYSMALLFAWAAATQGSAKTAVHCASGLALGFGLSAFYLLPAAYEQRWVNIAQALSSGLLPAQNFLFTNINDVEHTWFNWISSICAVILILFSALTAVASRKFQRGASGTSSSKSPWMSLLLLASTATFLMLRLSTPLWNLLPRLRFVQFPWRWMSVLAVAGCCFLAAAVERRRGWLGLGLYLLLAVPLGIFLEQNTWWDPDEMPTQFAALTSGAGFEGVDEYDPLGDDHLDLPKHAPLAAVLPASADDLGPTPPEATVHLEQWDPEEKVVSVDSPAAARVAVRLVNYPAWKVTVNGASVTPDRPDDVNQMLIPIPAGSCTILIRFARTPDRSIAVAISLLSLLVALFLWKGSHP